MATTQRWTVLILLAACGTGNRGSDGHYYVSLENTSVPAWYDIAFTTGNDALVMSVNSTMKVTDSEARPLEPPYAPIAMATTPAGVMMAHPGGFATSEDGESWTDLTDSGLPGIDGFASLHEGRDSVWIAFQVDTYSYALHKSSDGLRFEYVNTVSFPDPLADPDSEFGFRAVDGDTVHVLYRGWYETITLRSDDAGRTFTEVPTGDAFPFTRTADGIALGRGTVDTLFHLSGTPPNTQNDWTGVINHAGVPNHDAGIQVWKLDRDDRLWASVNTSTYRSRHPVTREELARPEVLAGPNCEAKHRLYEDVEVDGYGDQFNVTWENSTDEPLTVFTGDPNGLFHPQVVLAPGEMSSAIWFENQAFLGANDERVCRGIYWLEEEGQIIRFE